jgi:predicted secreted protein
MAVLSVALVAILGAAARESQLEPGTVPSPAELRWGRVAMAVTAAAILLILFFGNWWWNVVAAVRKDLMLYKRPPG